MKTALILTTAVAVTFFCKADIAKAKGPQGSHAVSSHSNNRYVKTINHPTYANQVITQKPIVITPPTLVQKAVILPIKTADLNQHLHHRHHRHRHDGFDFPDVDVADVDLDDEGEDGSCEIVEGVSDSKPAPSITAGTPADDDDDDDD